MPRYRVDLQDTRAHLYRVTLTLPTPRREQRLSLPAWIPGSYLVRDFARHLSGLQARQGQRAVELEQLDKHTWLARCEGRGALTVEWLVYAFDRSVRGAMLQADRGFFNASSLCLRAEGHESRPHALQLGPLPTGWQVATSMTPGPAPQQFVAADYDELLDHPVELGPFWHGSVAAAGIQVEVAVSGAWPTFDGPRLLADFGRIVATTVQLWHGEGRPPFERYVFLVNAGDEGAGGLEHRASTALACTRRDLPRQGERDRSDPYVGLLGLACHEFFHAWNVKRLRPREFATLDLGREQYTSLLWFFEGFTSYYDDLLLCRAGLIDAAQYLRLLSRTVSGVLASPGRLVQSVAAASFDAWVKYYRSDENTPNATISYYGKGALVALALDLTLREAGASLDELMRKLWQRCRQQGLTEDDVRAVAASLAGRPLDALFQAWVHGTDELPLQPLLNDAGVDWQDDMSSLALSLGLRLAEGPLTGVRVRSVLRGSRAEAAGLEAGDELIGACGWRLRRLDDLRQWLDPNAAFELLYARGERLSSAQVPAGEPAARGVTLSLAAAGDDALARRRGWIGG